MNTGSRAIYARYWADMPVAGLEGLAFWLFADCGRLRPWGCVAAKPAGPVWAFGGPRKSAAVIRPMTAVFLAGGPHCSAAFQRERPV
jgi:hypothetical protein